MDIVIKETQGIFLVAVTNSTIDASNFQAFKAAVSTYLRPGAQLVFDLSSVDFVDSTGLGALVSCLRQIHSTGGEIKLCGLTRPVRALFEMVRMHRIFEIFNNSTEALQSFQYKAAERSRDVVARSTQA
jgi:anti-sigma B factor antagonist